MKCDYDVVIAGGGMVGASLALALSRQSQQGIRILVVESFPLPPANSHGPVYRPSFDARSTALSYGSRLILEQLDIWPALQAHVASIDTIHVSEKGRLGSTLMHADELDWSALGYVVENAWLGNVLLSQLREQASVEFCCPASVTAIHPQASGVSITVDSSSADDKDEEPKQLSAQLVVVADGAQSALRAQLGIEASVHDYEQTAVIANVCFTKPHDGVAFERFTSTGPMALLPLSDSEQGEPRAALVWTNDHDVAQQLCADDDVVFLQKLQQCFGHRVGQFTRVGERASYPLKLIEAQEQFRSGVAVMGNAAHSLHPVAGQGFNLALRDCARLAQLLINAKSTGQALGDLSLLRNYSAQQADDQLKTVGFSDQVTRVFSMGQPMPLLRMLGLAAMDVMPPIKQQFVRRAAGMHDGAATGV